LDLVVFLLLIAPFVVLYFFAVQQGSLGFVIVTTAMIFCDLALASLVFFFLWCIGRGRDQQFGT